MICYLVLQSLLEWNGIEVLVRCASVLIHDVGCAAVVGDTFLGRMGETLLGVGFGVSSDIVILVSGLVKGWVARTKKVWRNGKGFVCLKSSICLGEDVKRRVFTSSVVG